MIKVVTHVEMYIMDLCLFIKLNKYFMSII